MASRRSNLRAVSPGEQKKRPASILEAAERGSRLEELQAMRRRIAAALDDPNTPARDLAALSRRQLEIRREVEAIALAEDEDRTVVVNADDEAWDGTGY